MSFGLGSSSAPSCNPSLAWSMGNGGKGRLEIKFPFVLDEGWYHEQECTKFRTFEHRKERKGFKHEFIVLELLDGSICRVERMGDPDARFDAITPRGSVAHDMAQYFKPEETSQACLGTSDTIARITLPCDFDIMDVLQICRAIHEGEKTRNYTLQLYNCWFFSLAIQVCLTRMVAQWGKQELFINWPSQVLKTAKIISSADQMSTTASSALNDDAVLELCDFLIGPSDTGPSKSFAKEVKRKLSSRLAAAWTFRDEVQRRINESLWYFTITPSLNGFIEDEVKGVLISILRHRVIGPRSPESNPDGLQLGALKHQLVSLLEHLLGSTESGARHMLSRPVLPNPKIKQKLVDRNVAAPEYYPKTDVFVPELDFKGTQAQTAETTPVAYQWWREFWLYLKLFAWWLLHVTLSAWGMGLLIPQANTPSCIIIDEELRSIKLELERSDGFTSSVLAYKIEKLRTLTKNQPAIWENALWDKINHLINQQVISDSTLVTIEEQEQELAFCSKGQHQSTTIPSFQAHILDRIEIHAREVERAWLGSASSIRTELVNMMSNIWRMIRVDEMTPETFIAHLTSQKSPNLTGLINIVTVGCYSPGYPLGPRADVWQGKLADGSAIAIKTIPIRSDRSYINLELAHEIKVWSKANHQNVLELLGIAYFNDSLVMISPWMSYSSITQYLYQHPVSDRLSMAIQLTDAVVHLHQLGIAHRKLQAKNVLVSQDGVVKLGNFGLAAMPGEDGAVPELLDDHFRPQFVRWMAPELLQDDTRESCESRKSDIYSLGMTIYEIFSNRVPFSELDQLVVVYWAVVNNKIIPTFPKEIKAMGQPGLQLWGLLRRCWDHDPKQRPTADQVLQELREIASQE